MRKLVLFGVLLTPLHLLEQLFTDFETVFADVQMMLAPIGRLFDNPDKAVLVALGVGIIPLSAAVYLAMGGPREKRLAGGIYGLLMLPEIHHITSAVSARGYYPGLVTGALMFATGLLLLKSAMTNTAEFRGQMT